MTPFFHALWALPPGGLSPLSKFIVTNGVFYLAAGVLTVIAPPLLPMEVLGITPSTAGSVQMSGVLLAIVGWFYVMGGRTGAVSFALATVVDRLLVPFVVVPLVWWSGASPMALGFAVLDPMLALWALALWRRQSEMVSAKVPI